MSSPVLQRAAFETSRLMEFFTDKELTMQIGYSRQLWPLVLVKELVDNSLDACEAARVRPEIAVTVDADSVSVADNGPGLPARIIERSLDYSVRVSDKAHYVSPTRGQLGNALKCVWAAACHEASDGIGRAEVVTPGLSHFIELSLDRISQTPRVSYTTKKNRLVKTGTLLKIHWPEIAGLLTSRFRLDSYISPSITGLVNRFSLFNPHAKFTISVEDDADLSGALPAFAPAWQKWNPSNLTSPHWYTLDRFRSLMGAYITNERNGGAARTVREFVSEFAGLSGSAKQKAVTDAAGLTGAYLHDLVRDGEIVRSSAWALLNAMAQESRRVKPAALGVFGESNLTCEMAGFGVASESIKYRKIEGESGSVPFVLEVGFGVYEDGEDKDRSVLVGLNWSPVLRNPIERLSYLLGEMRVDEFDPVLMAVHLASPRLDFIDRGKGSLSLGAEITEALEKCIKSVAAGWKTAKRQADRNDRVSRAALEQQRRASRASHVSIKDAAYEVMERAYKEASGDGMLPARARQIMYSARPLILALTGGRIWKNDSTFTQELLPDFVESFPALTADWNVVFDARGQMIEPHTKHRVELGTLAVREYVGSWQATVSDALDTQIASDYPTYGPAHRYKHVLFVEKEGFNELWKAVDLANRYDLAIMSTKGMSVTAVRELAERLSEQGVTIFVLRDFDKSGFSIVHTLRANTRRYQFKSAPKVIDLGLRLSDVQELGLQSEPVTYKSGKAGKRKGGVDPRENLKARGATDDECNFLVRDGSAATGWHGERVELNALGSARLVEWLEGKLQAFGVAKLVPDDATLAAAYRRAAKVARLQKAVNALLASDDKEIEAPGDLAESIKARIADSALSWDEAVFQLATQLASEVNR